MSTASPARTATSAPLWALRVTAHLTCLVMVVQGATAGRLLSPDPSYLGPHQVGAIATHVVAGLTALAAAWLWFATRGSLWPTVVAAVVFAVSFYQAAVGTNLAVHVPLAMVLLIGSVWVAVWSWRAPVAAHRAG